MMFKVILFLIVILSGSHSLACRRGLVSLSSLSPTHIDFTSSSTQTVNLQVTHSAPTTNCLYYLTVTYGGAVTWTSRVLESGANTLDYNVYKSSPTSTANILRDTFDITSINQIIYNPFFTASAGATTQSHSFIALLGAVAPTAVPGTYIDSAVLKLVTRGPGPFSSWPVVDERSIHFTYTVPLSLDISIVDRGAPFDLLSTGYLMSFGFLENGQQSEADIVIETNVGYRLRASSLNDGVLKHLTNATTINYDFEVDSTPVNLSGTSTVPLEIDSSPGPSPVGGFRVETRATISGMTGNENSGMYRDTIILTIEAF